jgi:O-antigen/teichoic acid export membrane protein
VSNAPALFKNTTVLAAARVIERSGSLVVAFFVSRKLGAAGLGTYATAIAYYQLISIAAQAGLTSLLIREIAKDRSKTLMYLVHGAVIAAAVSVTIIALAWTILPHAGYSHLLRVGLIVMAPAVLPGTLNTIQEAVFIAHERVELETLTTLGGTSVIVVISVVLLERGHGVVSLLATFVVVEFIVTLIYFVLINRFIVRLRWTFQRSAARALLRDMRPFAGSSLIAAIFARPEIIILSLLASGAQVGYYAAALKLVDVWQLLPQVYMVNLYPLFSRSYHVRDGRAQELQDRAVTHMLALALPAFAGIVFAARPIVFLLYGSHFGPAVLALRLLAANVLLYCLHEILWRVLAARGQQSTVLRVQVVSIVARLAIGASLIARWGAIGAAIATPISLAFQSALLARSVRHDGTKVTVRGARRYALAASLMAVPVALLTSRVDLWFLIPIAVAVYLVGVIAMRAVGPADLAVLRQLVRPTPRTPSDGA